MSTRRDIKKEMMQVADKNATLIMEKNILKYNINEKSEIIDSLEAKIFRKDHRILDLEDEIRHLTYQLHDLQSLKHIK